MDILSKNINGGINGGVNGGVNDIETELSENVILVLKAIERNEKLTQP